jgi:hypothetical protein
MILVVEDHAEIGPAAGVQHTGGEVVHQPERGGAALEAVGEALHDGLELAKDLEASVNRVTRASGVASRFLRS